MIWLRAQQRRRSFLAMDSARMTAAKAAGGTYVTGIREVLGNRVGWEGW